MVQFTQAFRGVLEFLGETGSRSWLTPHVHWGRTSRAGAAVFPPDEASVLNEVLMDLQDEVRGELDRVERRDDELIREGHEWLHNNADLFPEYFED